MAYHSVIIKDYVGVFNEYVANAALTPGHLVEVMSTGLVRKHASAGQNVLPTFAIEDALQGKGIDTAFAAGDQVRCWTPTRGDEVYAILADTEVVVVGDFLESDGLGCLKKHDPDHGDSHGDIYTNPIVGIALDAATLDAEGSESSAGGTHYPRIRVRIL
jgi:hypothetical protein